MSRSVGSTSHESARTPIASSSDVTVPEYSQATKAVGTLRPSPEPSQHRKLRSIGQLDIYVLHGGVAEAAGAA
eukprot:4191808-Prymnesium_polylepis.1